VGTTMLEGTFCLHVRDIIKPNFVRWLFDDAINTVNI
jgi:hypothetical protein